MTPREARVAAIANALLDGARSKGLKFSDDLRIGERDAANLLAMSPGTLKKIRLRGEGPVHFKIPIAGCRISYHFTGLADWIASSTYVKTVKTSD